MDAHKISGNLGAKPFHIFGGCMFVTVIWSCFYLPETANRTLAEIDEMYALSFQWENGEVRQTAYFSMDVDTDIILGYRTSSTSDAIMQQMESKMDTA